MIRELVRIDEEKCNGCGNCIPNCHEGALQIVNGKAVLVSDLMCDGLGACLGHCPEGALSIERAEAQPYDESLVMKEMVIKGKNVVFAHLLHLKEHNEKEYLKEGVRYLLESRDTLSFNPVELIDKVHNISQAPPAFRLVQASPVTNAHACPGSASREFNIATSIAETGSQKVKLNSALTHWPVQLHLINPAAEYFRGADLLVAADCTAFTNANFHEDFLKNKKLVIACPKLDHGLDTYKQKLITMISQANVNTITVLRMEVPCCGGLVQLVADAVMQSGRKIPVKEVVLGISGEILMEEWVLEIDR
jgi:NAD-dependent dihydropyrimidine dehydrogenase PreA subunit